MIRFKTLSIKNFLSYGAVPTVIDLDVGGTTLILGEDLDNTSSGTGGNGTGKTVIINALTYGLYDKPISNISKDNLVNNINKKNMEVVVEFEKGGKTYKIRRVRKAKAGASGNFVQLFEDGVDITPDSVANTNALIERIISLPYELFVRVVAFSATHTPFLDLPVRSPTAANQTDIIEELFDLKTLSEKAVRLKELIKQTEQSLETHKVRIDQLKKDHARHKKLIKSANDRIEAWEQRRTKEIEELEEKIEKVSNVDVESQQQYQQELGKLQQQLREVTTQITSKERSLKRKISEYKKLTTEKEHLVDDKCPYCLQQFPDADKKIEEISSKIDEIESQLVNLQQEIEKLQQEKEEIAISIEEVSEKITVSNIDELIKIRSELTKYQTRLKDLKQAENPHIESLNELLNVELEEIDMQPINELTDSLDHMKFLLKLLTKKDSFVRKALLNRNIPFLNKRLAVYLQELGLPHTVEFTHEMTAKISQFGRELDFGNLSNGQRARVNLALSFAFRDVLQSMHEHINICMLDEVLDVGLDTVGVQNAARMLKRKARDEELSLYIISHRDEISSSFDRKMIVKMSKGFSSIEVQD